MLWLAGTVTVLLRIHGAVQPVTPLTAGNTSSWENGAAPRYPESGSFPARSRTRKQGNDMRSYPSLYRHYSMSCWIGSDCRIHAGRREREERVASLCLAPFIYSVRGNHEEKKKLFVPFTRAHQASSIFFCSDSDGRSVRMDTRAKREVLAQWTWSRITSNQKAKWCAEPSHSFIEMTA